MNKMTLGTKIEQKKFLEEKIESRKEIITKRSKYTKHFRNDDGTYTMELNLCPIHYFDDSTKQYEEINNNFVETEDSFSIKGNSFKLNFAKEMTEDNLCRIKNDNCEITLKYKGKVEKNHNIFNKRKAKHKNVDNFNSSLVYEEIAPFIDLEYIINNNRIKENIIIKEKQEKYEFAFEMGILSLTPRLSEDTKNLELVDKEDKVKFIIPAPVMIDNNGIESNDVQYEFEEDNDVLKLLVIANSQWINATERIFPVKIDPQITVAMEDAPLKHCRVEDNIVKSTDCYNILLGKEMDTTYTHFIGIELETLKKLGRIAAAIFRYKYNSSATFNMITNLYNEDISKEQIIVGYNIKSYLLKNTSNIEMKKGIPAMACHDQLNKAIEDNEKYFMLVLSSNLSDQIVEVNLPIIEISYSVKNLAPSVYFDSGKTMLVEEIENYEIGILSTNNKGILTSYINLERNQAYQHYQVNNQLYLRESSSINSWGSWRRIDNISISCINGILEIKDN